MTIRRERLGTAPERVPSSVMAAVNSPGKMLPDALRRTAERHFEKDLSHVRLHDDSLAATAAAESRAHALTVGNDILLSRGRSDLSRTASQKTLAHEIAHTLQPASTQSSHFEPDSSAAETEASAVAQSLVSSLEHRNRPAIHNVRRGVARERDPRLDQLVAVVDSMPLVLSGMGIAEQLNSVAPRLNLDDPDNYEPLRLLLDEHFGPGTGNEVISAWRSIQSRPAASRPSERASTRAPSRTSTPEVVSAVSPASLTGTQLESEIALLRDALGMPPLNEDAPTSASFEPRDSNDQLRLDRLVALEAEYYDRRRLLESAREVTSALAEERREGPSTLETIVTSVALINPVTAPLGIALGLGSPGQDFVTGFIPGFLGGARLELPRDVFTRLDAEVNEHPFLYTGGVFAGVPVGALHGLRDLILGLVELVKLAYYLSPVGLTHLAVEEAARSVLVEGHTEERARQLEQAQEIGEAIVQLIGEMIVDRAFMLTHGEELGEIAGRASARWFSTDFMAMSTFDKGYLIGTLEGRILFEILALFLGPEEWIARGAVLIGEGVRISARLSRALLELIERIPALRRLITAIREGSVAAREAAAAERALAETGEAVSDASRLTDEAGDLARAGDRAEDLADPARATTADEAAAAARRLPDSISGCRIGSLFCPIDELLGREEFQEHLADRRRFFDYVGEFQYTDLDLGPSPRSLRRVRIETGDAMYRQYFEVFGERGTEPFEDAMQVVWRRTAQEGVDYRRIVINGREYRWPLRNGEPWTVHHEPPLEFIGFEDSALWRPMPLTIHDDVHRWWTGFRRSVLRRVPPELRREVIRGDAAFDIREFVDF